MKRASFGSFSVVNKLKSQNLPKFKKEAKLFGKLICCLAEKSDIVSKHRRNQATELFQ